MAFVAPKEMMNRLEESVRRHAHLTDDLSQADVIADRARFMAASQEHAQLSELVSKFESFQTKYLHYQESQKLLKEEKDKELLDLASQEIAELEPQLESEIQELQLMLLPKDPRDAKNAILELRQGVGGDEAGLFVGDLYRAYTRFAENQGWRVEMMSCSENSAGGFKEIVAGITGDEVFSKFKYESGVHRVQRVPKTETQGRVHTSTVTVAILAEADEVDIDIDPTDLRIDVMRASGSGGQHVNTTDSAVRITHLPTNQVVYCQDERSQHKNKAKAMKVLRSRLLEAAVKEQQDEETAERRSQVGGGFRNERIRTYNFPQGRVTDHRISMTTYNLDEVMEGALIDFIQALHNFYQAEELKKQQNSGA